jgi:riboflavin synthase
MFSGVIDHTGVVMDLKPLGIKAPASFSGLKLGSSVSVNGVCLTLVKRNKKTLFFDLVSETRKRSTLGLLCAGQRVNLELPLRWRGRVEGHFVLGHVDGIGEVVKISPEGRGRSLLVRYPKKLGWAFVEKGSVAVDGVSLTLGKVLKDAFWLHLIPHTLQNTSLQDLRLKSKVNLEADMLLRLTSRGAAYKL